MLFSRRPSSQKGFDAVTRFIGERFGLTLVIAFLAFCGLVFWQLSLLSSTINESSALQHAAAYSEALTEFRSLYTSEVVARLKPHGVDVTHDYWKREGAIPLPATLTMAFGSKTESEGFGTRARLFSDYPFPWRLDGGPRDGFENKALRALREQPNEPYARFEEPLDGRSVLRYATADLMRKSCINCHNTHLQSPKTDWKEGDVRGVLEVILPTDGVAAHTRNELLEAFALMMTLTALGLTGVGLVIVRLKRTSEQAEHFAEETKQTSDLILNSAAEGILCLDGTGRITLANPAAARMTRWGLPELIGKNASTLLGEDGLESLCHPKDGSTCGIRPHGNPPDRPTQSVFRREDGTSFSAEYMCAPIQHQLGVGTVVTFRDITDRIQAEQERDRFFELSLDMLCIAGLDGYFRRVNPAFERTLGFTAEEMLARPFLEFVHPDDQQRTMEEIRRLSEGSDMVHFENRYLCKDGSPRWFAWACPAAPPGEPLLYAVARDVTEQKKVENELAETRDRALEASRLKSEFLANMSHEIRTPMNVIIGMTELTLDSNLPVKQRRYLDMVKNSANSLLTIINGILDFSKIEAGKLELHPVNFNLVETVGEIVGTLTARARQKELRLSCQVKPGVPEEIVADSTRLRQVIVNLIGNATKFTERGEVRLLVDLESETDTDFLIRFAVSDTGIGIPEEKRELIFQTFVQADGSTTRRFGGTGLGLAITRQLVELMGGRIWLESEMGKGSTFFFTARLGRPEPGQLKVTAPKALEGVPVIVVDNDSDTQQIIAAMLDSWQMKSALVDSCAAALQVMKWSSKLGRHFQMVLVRDQLIKSDADSLAREIRKNPDFAEIPLPLILIAAEELEEEQWQEVGAAGCLTMPISQSSLLDTILGALPTSADGKRQAPRMWGNDSANAVAEEAGAAKGDSGRSLKVLLAEDIPENQALAVALLESRGHSVSVASNGREVLELFDKEAVDVILMDIQMPEMGGG